jgi:ABC-type sugar transport system ATPase subunit
VLRTEVIRDRQTVHRNGQYQVQTTRCEEGDDVEAVVQHIIGRGSDQKVDKESSSDSNSFILCFRLKSELKIM